MNLQSSPKGLLRIVGISFVVAGALYLVNLAMLASLGQLPIGGEAFLAFLHEHAFVGYVTIINFFFIDGLLILGFTGLYLLSNRNPVLTMATVLSVVALTADEINNVVFYSYINLSSFFEVATTDQQRMAYGAVSDFVNSMALGIGQSFFFVLFSLVIIAICFSGVGLLPRPTRYLGILSGVLGVVAGLSGLFPLIVLWPVWFLAVAYMSLRKPSG